MWGKKELNTQKNINTKYTYVYLGTHWYDGMQLGEYYDENTNI
jgi:hypothetical protein